jgi:hypothetical protein
MRTSVIRIALAAVLLVCFAVVGTASASADSTTCSASGTIKLSPGLSNEPTVQNVQIKAALSGCESVESEVTSGKINAHFKTAEPISCATLKGAGVGAAAEENKIILKWKPHGSGNSQGTASLPITEVPGALLTGSIAEGPFSEDAISGSLSQSYTGGPTCGEGAKPKKVKKGTVAGTLTVS